MARFPALERRRWHLVDVVDPGKVLRERLAGEPDLPTRPEDIGVPIAGVGLHGGRAVFVHHVFYYAHWQDLRLAVCDVRTGAILGEHLLYPAFAHVWYRGAVVPHPDGRRVFTAFRPYLESWDVATGARTPPRARFLHLDGDLRNARRAGGGPYACNAGVVLLPDGRRVVTARGQDIVVWDADTARPLRTIREPTGTVEDVALHPDGRTLIAASSGSILHVWDLETGQSLRRLRGHTARVLSVSIRGDGRLAASHGADGALRLWELPAGKCVHEAPHLGGKVFFHPEGQGLALAVFGGRKLRVFHLRTGKALAERVFEGEVQIAGLDEGGRVAVVDEERLMILAWSDAGPRGGERPDRA